MSEINYMAPDVIALNLVVVAVILAFMYPLWRWLGTIDFSGIEERNKMTLKALDDYKAAVERESEGVVTCRHEHFHYEPNAMHPRCDDCGAVKL